MSDFHRQMNPFEKSFVLMFRLVAMVMDFEIFQHDLDDEQRRVEHDEENNQCTKNHRFEFLVEILFGAGRIDSTISSDWAAAGSNSVPFRLANSSMKEQKKRDNRRNSVFAIC